MRDSATQIEDQIDKTRNTLHQNKMGLARLKGQINRVDSKDPSYVSYFRDLCWCLHLILLKEGHLHCLQLLDSSFKEKKII